MNPEYTESDLIGFRAAYCDDATQNKFLDIIAAELSDYPYNLQTFEGSRTVPLLETEYGLSGLHDAIPLNVEIGSLIKVAPPLNITFDRRRKHNTLICGSNERMAEDLANLYISGMETEYAQYAEAKATLDACGISRQTLTEEKTDIYEQLAQLNKQIRAERQKIKLCREIADSAAKMQQDIAVQEKSQQEKEVSQTRDYK